MDSGKAQYLYSKYAPVMAYVSVESPDGTPNIGSAFHVGEGVFVTARHVVENKRITEVAMTERTYIRLEGDEAIGVRTFVHIGSEEFPVHTLDNGLLQVQQGPFFHPDPKVDVAAFKVAEIDARTPYVNLGDHLDDWLGASDFVLAEVIILGYPPIPMTRSPYLVAARAEVNAQVDLWGAEHVHFILSSMPRGGFSGGLAITESEFALGVITSSLLTNEREPELGFFAVLSVEPIYNCLAHNKIVPEHIDREWHGFWNEDASYFLDRNLLRAGGNVVGSVTLYSSASGCHLEISCDEQSIYDAVLNAALNSLSGVEYNLSDIRKGMVKIELPDGTFYDTAYQARKAAEEVFIKAGFIRTGYGRQ